jgi:AcrR family transcriptional regulator
MAYRRTERVEARLADNRARILHAARTLVSEQGFRETQVSLVASRAEVAVGAKADLFAEVVRTVSQREADVLREIADSGGSASERLAAAVRAFASRAIRGRRLAYAVIAEPVDPEVDDARLEYRRILCGAIERIIHDGIEHAEFPPQAIETSAACLVGAVIEGLVGPLAMERPTGEADGARLIDAIERFARRAVSGLEQPRAEGHER